MFFYQVAILAQIEAKYVSTALRQLCRKTNRVRLAQNSLVYNHSYSH